MGFFSFRRAELSPQFSVNSGAVSTGLSVSDKSVVQLIRSRFYGKTKKNLQPSVEYASSSSSTEEPSHRRDQSRVSTSCGVQSQIFQSLPTQHNVHLSSTDAITITLAQRLNELAIANAEGFLSDDEYRVLRHNVFERFASVSKIPTETPVVKSVGSSRSLLSSASRVDLMSMNSVRSPSYKSHSSVGSSMSNMFRRVTKRTVLKRATRDQVEMSIMSSSTHISTSRPPNKNHHLLDRQRSLSSIRTERSRYIHSDFRSISSRRSGKSTAGNSEGGRTSRGGSKSLHGSEPPPSSFTAKHLVSPAIPTWSGDKDCLQSAVDIRAEIHFTEAEERRLLDAFNALELSALIRNRRNYSLDIPLPGCDKLPTNSEWTLVHEQLSSASEMCSDRKMVTNDANQSPNFHPLSQTSLTGPLESVFSELPGCEPALSRLCSFDQRNRLDDNREAELGEICRRKAEILERYQQRLEYLKARLKGAEIHERLMQK
ncbi:hypothetical protein EW145_g4804 [Phellinidium pouzarii]|uniref:Uncharacterized protein n=1 Tax=Phellinidium pouzarii TaxID=167371 RepID=A0A4S4L2E5_9AGAM|nr:hypothetical protein EW145_g4804 [Phellinidium pouzarii]